MADAIIRKVAKDKMRSDAGKRNGYIFSAPNKNERGQKLKKSEKARWEMERYTDPRWAIPELDLKILMEVKRRAKQLDAGHRIGPLKFGQSAILGLVPVIGDFADCILAYGRVYRKARTVSAGEDVFALKSKMKARIVASGVIGSIPMLGDFADTLLMFNTRNAASLERLLLTRSGYFEFTAKEKASKGSWGRRVHNKPSEESLPPPRYRSTESTRRPLPAQHVVPSRNTTQQATKPSNGWITNFKGSNFTGGQKIGDEAVPQRPPRPVMTGVDHASQHSNHF